MGGFSVLNRKCYRFRERVNASNLMDPELVRNKYTWKGPMIHGEVKVYERFNITLCNDSWRIQFPYA